MTRSQCYVVVVGGGTAGGMAEYELAHRGVDVLLLEKERLPRYKTCAGGIPLKKVQLLDLDLSSACEMTVTKGSCTYRGTSPVLMFRRSRGLHRDAREVRLSDSQGSYGGWSSCHGRPRSQRAETHPDRV